jgi:hypothetical protein
MIVNINIASFTNSVSHTIDFIIVFKVLVANGISANEGTVLGITNELELSPTAGGTSSHKVLESTAKSGHCKYDGIENLQAHPKK